ncbi:MAG TPA: cytochrome P450 [Ktedonobacterales bacterium]
METTETSGAADRARREVPAPGGAESIAAARAFARGGVLAALEALRDTLGDVFQLPLPGFSGIMLAGPEAARFVLTESREGLLWRAEQDPVTRLLRRGMLVTDGDEHDALRHIIAPVLHKRLFESYARAVGTSVDRVTARWGDGEHVPVLEDMRRIALLSLMGALYDEDFAPHLRDLWPDIERAIRFISPGPWLIWPSIPRPGYRRAIERLDRYFLDLIARRRATPGDAGDIVSALIAAGLSDELIRDQLLTMFIAGHDTSAALLAWSLALLARHPAMLATLVAEIDALLGSEEPAYLRLGQAPYLDRVIKEALRLYPPIHLGSRIAATDLVFQQIPIPAGTRVLYSIYLTHRDRRFWRDPEQFAPDRFLPDGAAARPAYAYIPFGGGPRNCIGAAFAQWEAKLALARLLQRFSFQATGGALRARMRATLEPHPDMRVAVYRRQSTRTSGV